MDAMKTTLSLAVAVGVALLVGGHEGWAQTPEQLAGLTPEQLAIVRQLGPDGFAGAPPLSTLVGGTAVAIVGRVLGTDGLDLRDGYAWVAYRVAVDDVLISPNVDGAPRLVAGAVTRLEQRGRGDLAQRYFTGKLPPVGAEDTCLLFLDAGPSGVSLIGWVAQFRRAPGPTPTAETFGPA